MDCFTRAEREFTLEQAGQRVQAELETLGLGVEQRQLGRRIVAVQIYASADNGRSVTRGSGKGYPPHAQVGALYETLEHYLSDGFNTQDIRCISPRYFSNVPLFVDDSVLAPLMGQPEAKTACRTYTDLNKHTSFYYPVALCTPNYPDAPVVEDTTDYSALRRYASNSGTAIGASYNEAVLHAVNECIERDALSLFILDHFYYRNRPALRRVARMGADDELGRLWLDAESEISAPIVLLDISSEFLPRTFLAFSMDPGAHPRVAGSGCSLNPRHAAWRALTELVQLHHATAQPEQQRERLNAQRHLSPFPRLLRCLQLDLHSLPMQSEQITVELPEATAPLPLAEQITCVAADLHRHGRTLGVTQLYQSALGTTLVNVVIPGLERFFVVSSGNVVVPQARGRRLHKKCGVPA